MKGLSQLSRSIAGSVAIITGAASGMGRATAHLFADEGARLGLLDIDSAGLDVVAEEIRASGGEVLALTVDLAARDAVQQAVAAVAAHFGAIDILVNNAGIVMPASVDADNFDQSWDASLAVMAGAQAWAIRAALPSLRQAPHPRIVNIASTEALGATRYISAYTVAKHASLGLTRAMAVELGSEGITVNCVCPGPIRTAMTQQTPEEDKLVFAKRRTVLRRYGEPEEVAHATLSLVLPAAGFITGATLVVDGGLTIRNA
jgi:3-oxoacyl-[acyl-carrier protein] reductase